MAPPILFLHGVFAQGGVFDAWVRYFEAAGFECHAPSLPGRDPTDHKTLRNLRMSDNLDALLVVRQEFSEAPIVIGHSMGGLLAQKLAARTETAALVLVGASPPGVLWAHPKALPRLFRLLPTILMGRPLRPSDQTLRAVVFNELDDSGARQESARIVPDSGKVFRAQILGTERVPRGSIKCPVFALNGEKDINGSPGTGKRIAERYNAKHRVIPGSDHWIIAPSRVGAVCPLIYQWLEEQDLAPATERSAPTR